MLYDQNMASLPIECTASVGISSTESVAMPPSIEKGKSPDPPESLPEDGELSDEEASINCAFKVDVTQIETVAIADQAAEIQFLGLAVYDQGTLEQGILSQVEEETKRRAAQAQLVSVSAKLKAAEEQLKRVENVRGIKQSLLRDALTQPMNVKSTLNDKLESQKVSKEKEVQELRSKRATLKEQLSKGRGEPANKLSKDESERERKVRMGEMTPFGTSLNSGSSNLSNFENYLKSQKELHEKMIGGKHTQRRCINSKGEKMQETRLHTSPEKNNSEKTVMKKKGLYPKKKRKKEQLGSFTSSNTFSMPVGQIASETSVEKLDGSGSEYVPSESDCSNNHEDSDFCPNDEETGSKDKSKEGTVSKVSKRKSEDRWAGGSIKRRKMKKSTLPDEDPDNWNSDDSDWICTDDEGSSDNDSTKRKKRHIKREMDDGNEDDYYRRMKQWERSSGGMRSEMEEEFHEFDHGFKVPLLIWDKLYKYQQIGVRWLWELHIQRCGGILGDEMGLGKTIQIISFLSGLSISKLKCRTTGYRGLGPTLIVCPTTVMHQWVREFHTWCPSLRVAILHESGSYTGKRTQLVREIVKAKGILITSYTAVVRLKDCLVNQHWHYMILDEGHKIRNPDAQVTLVVKQMRTPHRLILSGSPMQNNLRELWSLFDFVFPGKLGTLPVFMQEFAVPITQGGYSNASEVMVATAFKCATVLRDTISPYLLRRMKSDVSEHIKLPTKNEQVLFCRLTDEQRNLYKGYLECGEVSRILEGRMQIFVGLINLRKICNHPHLYSGGPKIFAGESEDDIPIEERYGYWNKAGKMIVIEALLKMWRRQEHRVLIFTQSRQMLLIMESFVRQQGYSYLKLDGGTSIAARQPLINKFNEDKSYFLMLLTTKVGGLGVNLTGANRIVIYDPDWNPATDTQARERAWRIGQKSSVTVYRLITAGTIEEKMYHRQIFKQFLCNKVLKDPRQRRFFKSNDLLELFTLKETDSDCTETAAIFAGTGSQVRVKNSNSKNIAVKSRAPDHHASSVHRKSKSSGSKVISSELGKKVSFSQDKLDNMKRLAHELSLKVALKAKDQISSSGADPVNQLQDKIATCTEHRNSEVKVDAQACNVSESPSTSETEKTLGPTSDDELENMKQLAVELSQELSNKVAIAASLNLRISGLASNSNCDAEVDKTKDDVPSIHGSLQKSMNVDTDGSTLSSTTELKKNLPDSSSLCKDVNQTLNSNKVTTIVCNLTSGKTEHVKDKAVPTRRKSQESESPLKSDHRLHHKKHKKHKKNRKHKHVCNIKFEGEKVPNLVATSSFENITPEEMKKEAAHSAKQDDYVLRKLFAKTGLQTAMQHDKVMESGHADFALVEGEARRVAEDAVKAMKASRRHCWNAMAGVPTWTGASGSLRSEEQNPVKARPKFGKKSKTLSALKTNEVKEDKPSEGTGSSGLLARIRERNMLLTETDEAGPSAPVKDNHKELLDDVRTFVAFGASVDGRATTDEIISQFRDRLPPQTSALFKQMLMQICEFHRLPSGQGVWKLIPEFNW